MTEVLGKIIPGVLGAVFTGLHVPGEKQVSKSSTKIVCEEEAAVSIFSSNLHRREASPAHKARGGGGGGWISVLWEAAAG